MCVCPAGPTTTLAPELRLNVSEGETAKGGEFGCRGSEGNVGREVDSDKHIDSSQ